MADAHGNIETIGWVVHGEKQDFVLEELILGDMQDDELLVDMKYSGICHTVSFRSSSRRQVPNANGSIGSRFPTRRDQSMSLPSRVRTRRRRDYKSNWAESEEQRSQSRRFCPSFHQLLRAVQVLQDWSSGEVRRKTSFQ